MSWKLTPWDGKGAWVLTLTGQTSQPLNLFTVFVKRGNGGQSVCCGLDGVMDVESLL